MAGFLEVQLGLHNKKFVGRICWVELGSTPRCSGAWQVSIRERQGLTHPYTLPEGRCSVNAPSRDCP